MKKTISSYGLILAFIYLSYIMFALIFAVLFHYANLQPSFYSIATKICSYTVVFSGGIGFSLIVKEKRLIKGMIFIVIFSAINSLLLWHRFNLVAILLKGIIFIAGVVLINLVKK